MILLTEVIIVLMSLGLIFHSLRVEGKSFALIFWGAGGLLGFLRECFVVWFTPLYDFGDFTFTVLGIPVIMALFWSNFSYVALRWTENLFSTSFVESSRVDDQLPVIFAIMAAISLAFEAFASQYNMIIWRAQPVLTLWGGTPVVLPFAYGAMGVLYLSAFRMIWRQRFKDAARSMLFLMMLVPLIILIQHGFLMVVKVIIGLLLGT